MGYIGQPDEIEEIEIVPYEVPIEAPPVREPVEVPVSPAPDRELVPA